MGLQEFIITIAGKGGPMTHKGKTLIPKGESKPGTIRIITDEIEEHQNDLFENLAKEHQTPTIEKGQSSMLNINNQEKELLQYAKELCITSDFSHKDFVSGQKNTNNFMERNMKAEENFFKLFKEIYKDKILKTKEGDELQFDEMQFTSNSNIYTLIFRSQKEESFDKKGKRYYFVSGGPDIPIYQKDVRNYDKYIEGMNTQFNFEDESRKELEKMLSYNNNSELFSQYRTNSFNK